MYTLVKATALCSKSKKIIKIGVNVIDSNEIRATLVFVPDFLVVETLEVSMVCKPGREHNIESIASSDGDTAQKVDDN